MLIQVPFHVLQVKKILAHMSPGNHQKVRLKRSAYLVCSPSAGGHDSGDRTLIHQIQSWDSRWAKYELQPERERVSS